MKMEKYEVNEETSDFKRILADLNHEMNRSEEYSQLILEKACKLDEFREEEEVNISSSLEEKSGIESDRVIPQLQGLLNGMRRSNNTLNEIKEGLTKLLG